MMRPDSRRLLALGAALLVLAVGAPASAQLPNKCAGTKIKTIGKTAKCLLGLDAKSAKSGDPVPSDKEQKCKDKLSTTYAKAEAKGGCIATGDAQAIEDKVDLFRDDVTNSPGVGLPNACQAAKIKAAGIKAACLLGLEAKQATKGVTPSPDKVQKCKDKLSSAFSKSEAKGGCNTTGDAQEIEDKVDAFVEDAVEELTIPPSTTTTTAASTTTTTAASTTTTTAASTTTTALTTTTTQPVSFSQDVQPIFTNNCAFTFQCHGPPFPQQGLDLSAGSAYGHLVNVPSTELPNMDRVEPGDPANSWIIHKLEGTQGMFTAQCQGMNCGAQMPLFGSPLPPEQIDTIRSWIAEGAAND